VSEVLTRLSFYFFWTKQDCGLINEDEDNLMSPTIVPECLSTQLKTFMLSDNKCTEYDIQFAEYIIQNSKVLKTMSITSSLPFSLKRKMIEKLASSTRASTTCKLLIV
jgi:hypothetical protein